MEFVCLCLLLCVCALRYILQLEGKSIYVYLESLWNLVEVYT